ncbi:DHA3 family macrolide efflux protein-like MFS transporter [Lachnospiraceae bacterium PF1-21]|uniref:MFS transporter n=1 Tax=Ohessyouella blattaphilus TaxID=2949333 RepID=A0ABT1EGS5_9FIRM|nr:MFS transporter [Ohessyouella blattaphilus]MCP1109905.1 MFS transporter [Ohessyouella blattaphilus]MCR8563299.1 MFS transporter [Ohessyouella blattaphilus]MDL2249545.1 MFS transporter [Lachnospiraceae bacterium OttesenSCG-928-J05]
MNGIKSWKKNFFTIWTGQAFSQLSSSVLQFAIVWYLTDRTGSALVLSAAMLMGFLPQGVLGPFIGVFIDRYNRKKIMILSDLLISLASLVMVLAGALGFLTTGLIMVILLLRSIGTAFHTPCLQAVTPQIVPTDQLTKCAGYSQSLESISQILSPVIAAVLYQTWSLGGIVFLDVIGALIAVFALTISHVPKLERSEQSSDLHVLREAKEGFRILRTNRGMLGLVFISALYTLALMPTSALFPLMSMSYFGGTSTHASIIEVIFSVGLLVGSLILSKWGGTKNRIYTIVGSYLLMSACLFVSGMLPPSGFVGFVICSLMMGVSGPFYWGMYTPLIQSKFADEYLGRVLSLAASIRLIVAPIGLSLSGVFAEIFGVEKWFLIAGGLTLIAATLCLSIPVIRHADIPNTQENE